LGSKLNDSRSHINLGFCYQEGKGIERNLMKAKNLYELADLQGNKRAQRFLHAFPSAQAVCERETSLFTNNKHMDLKILKENCDTYTFALELIEIFIYNEYPDKILKIKQAIIENNHSDLLDSISLIFDCSKTFGIIIMDKKSTRLRSIGHILFLWSGS
jgi:hypothetical protein